MYPPAQTEPRSKTTISYNNNYRCTALSAADRRHTIYERKVNAMSGKERKDFIKRIITEKKRITVTELRKLCGVTDETIRRDLDKLEREGVVTRVHGGAILNTEGQKDSVHFNLRMGIHMQEKRNLAEKAIPLLIGKHTIAADSSTTVSEVLRRIPNSSEITIVTNSTEVFHTFENSDINVISTGGDFNKKSLSLSGTLAKKNLAKYNFDIALISCKGLDIEQGALDSNEEEAEIKRQMIRQSASVALLVDHTKFDKTAYLRLLDLESVDYLITDQKPEEKWIDYCAENGIELIYGVDEELEDARS